MTFRVGQKVCCVDAVDAPKLVKERIYTIRKIIRYPGDTPGVLLHEVEPSEGYRCYESMRFRPIVERKTSIEIFTAMLNPSKVEA